MRTLRSIPRTSTTTVAAAAACAITSALALTACGGGGSGKTPAAKTPVAANQPAPSTAPAAPQTSDPAQGLVQDPARLPKTCSGLVNDAEIQLALGSPLVGAGNIFTAYQPLPTIKQTGKVKCAYGVVQGSDGKVQSDEIEVQVATYADPAAAQSRGAATVAGFAAQGAQYKQVTVSGHPATYVTESADSILVMYDGNRTFLITVNALLAKDDAGQKLALALGDALIKRINAEAGTGTGMSGTPTSPASPATPGSTSGGAPLPGGSATAPNPATTPTS